MTRDKAFRRLVSNTRWNLVAFVVALLANFLSIPLVISAIGLSAFGAAGLVLAMLAPFALVGTVLGQGIVREFAPRHAVADHEGCQRVWVTAVAQAGIAALGVGVLVALLGTWALQQLSAGGSRAAPSWAQALAWGFVAWLAQQACLLLQAVLASLQSFGRLAVANSVGGLAGAVATVAVSRALPDERGFLAGTALGFGVMAVALAGMVRAETPWLLRRAGPDRSIARSLFGFARWQALGHLSGAVANQVDRYVLGAVAPLSAVGQYNVAMRLQEVVHMGVLKMAEVLYPHFSAHQDASVAHRAAFYARASWVVNLLSVAALAPLIPLAEPLVTLWVSAEAADGGAVLLRTLATAGLIGCATHVFSFMAMAGEAARQLAAVNLAHGLVLVAVTVPAILVFGPLAAGLSYVLANALRLIAAFVISIQHFGGALRPGLLLASMLPAVAAGLLMGWGMWLLALVGVHSWPQLGLAFAAAFAATVAVGCLLTASTADGRALLRHAWAYRRGSSSGTAN
jgi:O-antigen/teichoic acid export membrane protein